MDVGFGDEVGPKLGGDGVGVGEVIIEFSPMVIVCMSLRARICKTLKFPAHWKNVPSIIIIIIPYLCLNLKVFLTAVWNEYICIIHKNIIV